MSKVKVEVNHLPSLSGEFSIDAMGLKRELEKLRDTAGISWSRINLDDGQYFYLSWEDWGKVIEHIKKAVPSYISQKFDCDNFARWFNTEVARLFEINTMAIVGGWVNRTGSPMRHKWNVFFTGDAFYQMERQTGCWR